MHERPVVTVYEHRDHRNLPVGTKIYVLSKGTLYVYPGTRTPAAVVGRKPDIIVVKDDDR